MKQIIIFLIFITTLNAQDEKPMYWIGANAGLNLNYNSADFDGLPGYDCCSKGFGSQMGLSYYLGLLFKYEIQDNLKLDVRLNYKPYAGQFIENQKIGNTQVLTQDNQVIVVNAMSDITIDPVMNLFGLDLGVEYLLIPNISILGGLSPSYILQANFSQKELLTTPNNVVFADNQSKVRNSYNNKEILNLNALQFQAYIGVAYKYLLKKDNFINFELKYYQSFTNISSVDWKLNNIFAGVSYEYPIYPKKEKAILNDTIYNRDTTNIIVYDANKAKLELVDSQITNKSLEDDDYIRNTHSINEKYNNYIFNKSDISATMKIYGINEDGSIQDVPTITIEETESEEGFPVLPYIFFEVDKSELNNTGQNLISKDETSRFDENNLKWDVFDIYGNTLNIIAKRIKDNRYPIELIGNRIISTNTFEDVKMIEKRLKDVKDYLADTWDIDPNKISTKVVDVKLNNLAKTDDMYIEASRVELNSNNVKVIQPVYLKEIVKSSNPPKIGVDVVINATNPPVSWNFNIDQDENKIRNYNGNDLKFTKIWNVLEEPMPKLEDNLEFKLNAKDNVGSQTDVKEDLQIKQLTIKKKREVLNKDKKLEKYSLIIFDYNSAELKEIHKDVIAKVKASIKANSEVTIAGYADRTGEETYNHQLALKRIEAVKKLLDDSANYKMIPYGSSVLLYDNNTAVGRSLSRTVQISIETPVK